MRPPEARDEFDRQRAMNRRRETVQAYEDAGVSVCDPDVTTFTMGRGVHCMAQALRRDPVEPR